nr:zinc finger BED domain-containing protein RICESLEEPER 2-like [Ipomoea batatas]
MAVAAALLPSTVAGEWTKQTSSVASSSSPPRRCMMRGNGGRRQAWQYTTTALSSPLPPSATQQRRRLAEHLSPSNGNSKRQRRRAVAWLELPATSQCKGRGYVSPSQLRHQQWQNGAVGNSKGRMKVFEECVEKVGIKLKLGLSIDVPTRWNSAYKMLDTAIKYRRAFSSLQLLDTNYKHCPSQEEWARVEKICDFLMPFNEITKLFSGSTYPTSNLYFRQVWKIEYLLTMNMKSGDSVIKDMACKMKIKFDKYWEQYSVILAMGAVLDPRMKFKLLEFCYKKLDGSTYQEKLDIVKNKLYMLFEAYKATSLTATTSSTASTSRCENVVAMEASDDFDDEFLDYCVQDNMQNGKSALDVYLDEPQMDMKSYASLDILNFWKDNKHRFGELSLMACDVLSIPITTVASESAFSIGGRVLNKYRNSLLPSNVQALICTRNWLSGFELDDKDLPVHVPTESSEA